jgi:hypothetical protein
MLQIKNKGVTKTVIKSNGRSKTNKINWDVDYDGEKANISLDIEDDGIKDHYSSRLTNDDIAQLLNPPQNEISLDERLLNDYGNETPQMVLQFETPKNIVIQKPKRTRKYVIVKKRPSTRRNSSRRNSSRRNSSRRNKKRSIYVRL